MRDDVAVGAVGFTNAGVRIMTDYVVGSGFGGLHDPGLSLVSSVARARLDTDMSDDLVVLDGGALIMLTGWNGSAFLTQTPVATTQALGTSLATGQLSSTTTPGDLDEVIVGQLSNDQLAVWHDYFPASTSTIPGTGCPPGSSFAVASLTDDPVLGELAIVISLDGATPFSLAFLSAQVVTPQGSMPSVMTVGGCGLAMTGGPIYQYNAFTDALGSARMLSGAPNNPELVGLEYILQWGILDGGPLLSGLTVSDALHVIFGEI